jgi:hypothetical protein
LVRCSQCSVFGIGFGHGLRPFPPTEPHAGSDANIYVDRLLGGPGSCSDRLQQEGSGMARPTDRSESCAPNRSLRRRASATDRLLMSPGPCIEREPDLGLWGPQHVRLGYHRRICRAHLQQGVAAPSSIGHTQHIAPRVMC